MKTCPSLVIVCSMLAASELAFAQSTAIASELVRGRIVAASPQSKVMSIVIEPGRVPVDFYGLDRARIEMSGGRLGTFADLRPGATVAVYYQAHEGRAYLERVVLPDANLAVPVTPLT